MSPPPRRQSFSGKPKKLTATVRCDVEDCKALEQLLGSITRPALANERVAGNAAQGRGR
jgi:hypothetical protein